ncbi:MAG: rod shape-determining protein MreC [Deltaproteobacteria bacterium HGW-Deltaproteobacteria-6]|jgi:rod shape-determining protein MreC|nr:MAG: rod shape-determining protein MreC [Deltaproteobacteria bacterium HGW-Deltaproteobacteria-6]
MFFKNYRTVIFIGVVVAAALVLLSYSLKYDSGAGVVKKLVLEAATPVQRLFNASIEGVENAWLRYIHLVGLEEDNRSLKNKIAALQAELILYKEGYLEAQRLKKLLSLLEDRQYKFTAARVIAKEQAALSKTLWIDKGSAHGLKSGMPVLVPPGLIGRLTDVSWHSSKVLLLIDENSNVDVLIQRTRVQGIVRGAGSRGCVVRYISKVQDVKEGDVVVTSGMSNIFPKGLLIGKVSHVDRMDVGLFLQIRVAPFVDFSMLEEVLVLTTGQGEFSEGKKTAK